VDKNLFITFLKRNVNKNEVTLFKYRFYLFGSFLYSINPNDIDLLIVYNKERVKHEQILELRKNICSKVIEVSHIKLDVTILDVIEEKEFGFINKVNAEEIILF
jgi:hypothetical protein